MGIQRFLAIVGNLRSEVVPATVGGIGSAGQIPALDAVTGLLGTSMLPVNVPTAMPTLATLETSLGAAGQVIFVPGDQGGWFQWMSGDQTALYADEPTGVMVRPLAADRVSNTPGLNGVWQRLLDKDRRVSVLWFGASCDSGITDNAPAIRAACAYAAPRHLKVYIPSGGVLTTGTTRPYYGCLSSITMTISESVIEGDGDRLSELRFTGCHGIIVGTNSGQTVRVCVKNLFLRGDAPTSTSPLVTFAIWQIQTLHCTFENVNAQDFCCNRVWDAYNGQCTNNVVTRCDTDFFKTPNEINGFPLFTDWFRGSIGANQGNQVIGSKGYHQISNYQPANFIGDGVTTTFTIDIPSGKIPLYRGDGIKVYAQDQQAIAKSATVAGTSGGHVVGELLTENDVGITPRTAAVFKVATVDPGTGNVLTVTVPTAGSYATLPNNPISLKTAGGAVSDVTLNVTWFNTQVYVPLGVQDTDWRLYGVDTVTAGNVISDDTRYSPKYIPAPPDVKKNLFTIDVNGNYVHSAPSALGLSINPKSANTGNLFMRLRVVFTVAPTLGQVFQINWCDPTGCAIIRLDTGNGNQFIGGLYAGASDIVDARYGPNKFDFGYVQFCDHIYSIGPAANGNECPLPPCQFGVINKSAYSIDPTAFRTQTVKNPYRAPSRAVKTQDQPIPINSAGFNYVTWNQVVGEGKLDPLSRYFLYPPSNPGAARLARATIRGKISDTTGNAKTVFRLYASYDGSVTPLNTSTDVPISVSIGGVANGSLTYVTNPGANSTVTINGTVVTFVASGATGNQVLTGASLAVTLQNLVTFLNASTDSNIAQCTYTLSAGVTVNINYKMQGAGYTFTVAASQGTVVFASASTLTTTNTGTLAVSDTEEFCAIIEYLDTTAQEHLAGGQPYAGYRVGMNIINATTSMTIYGAGQNQSDIKVTEISSY